MVSLKIPNSMQFIDGFVMNFVFWFLPLLFVDLGFSGIQIGILVSCFWIVSLFVAIPIGIIDDRYSIREVVFLGFLLMSVFYFGLAMFKGFWPFLVFYLIGGLGHNMIKISTRSINFKLSKKKNKGKRLGFYQLAVSGGFGIGSMAGGILLFAFDFSPILLLASVIIFGMSFAAYFVPKVRIHHIPLWEYEREILKKSVIFLFFATFLFGLHWGAELTSHSLFLKTVLNLNMWQMGLYMGGGLIAMALSGFMTGRHVNKTFHPKRIFFIGILISGLGHILMTIPVPLISFLFRAFHEVGDGMFMVSFYFILSDIFKKKIISGESSVGMTMPVIGAIVGSLIFGHLGSVYGYHWPFIITGVISLLSLLFLIEEQRKIRF